VGNTQESQFKEVMARCFSTPAVHIVEVPISYEASTVLQVTGP
jgi:hypothetical protein